MCSHFKYFNIFLFLINLSINFKLIEHFSDEFDSQILPNYNESQIIEWNLKILEESNPSEWPGENGEGVDVPENKETYDKYFKVNQFNILASDRIALNRTLKDERMTSCLDKEYRDRLPQTSVIIVFHNEAFSTLLRTLYSVIKTSSNLLLEIILVDDSSNRVYLRRQLEDHVKQLSVPIKILRMSKRLGLIKARLMGSAHAKGQVLMFMDSHCECNEGWLEPLLDRIAGDRTRVVCPIIDVIDENNFEYIAAGDMIYGGFNWKIGFRWMTAPKRELKRRNNDRSLPLRSPTLSGGLFAIDRDFFEYIGKYDPGMVIWGAENLEISFRIWMFGGSIEIVTCSRIGHVFRSITPYTLPGGADYVVWHNTARTVDVWLDEWKDFYYALHPGARSLDRGSIESRVLFRKQRTNKSFRWYLDNIYPESYLPKDYYYLGDIRNVRTNHLCLDTMYSDNDKVILSQCHLEAHRRVVFNQLFMFSKKNEIINDEKCLDVQDINQIVLIKKCRFGVKQQKWIYDQKSQTLLHWPTKGCLDVIEKLNDFTHIVLKTCDDTQLSQKWILQDNFEWQSPSHQTIGMTDNNNKI